MATCVGSITVGFASCWQISLLTLATGPFILAAGVVSNIALTRLAEHVHDSYSEASSIAEQVCTKILVRKCSVCQLLVRAIELEPSYY